jgi:hypothetical protein
MNCPTCCTEMTSGTLQSKTSFFSTATPASYDDQKWYFISNDNRKQKLERSIQNRPVLKCPSCGLIVIPNDGT